MHRDPEKLVRGFRAARRAGGIGGFVSIYRQYDAVNIASDGGRVCRPLIICEHGMPKVTAEHTAKVGSTMLRVNCVQVTAPAASWEAPCMEGRVCQCRLICTVLPLLRVMACEHCFWVMIL